MAIFHYKMGSNAILKLNSITVDLNKYIKNVKGVHYSWHLDEQFTVVFMTVIHSPQMLLSFKFTFEPIL